jgi:hypothetical protein
MFRAYSPQLHSILRNPVIESVVYFAGPKSVWSNRPAESEFIARFQARWVWLAQSRAMSLYRQLNCGRCGYFVARDGEMIVHVQAENLTTQGLA